MATPENLSTCEAEIQTLIAQEKQGEARTKLFELIVACAQGGDLHNANRLRDVLYEVDPMALQDIIKANEMIEEAMSGAVDDTFNKAWFGLREALAEEEFLAFYHALQEHEVEAGKSVVKVGSKLDAILFVNQGNISVTCRCGDKTVDIKTLEPGIIINENCFHPSAWTVSLTCLSPVNLSILRRDRFVELAENFPGFEGRLITYCQQFDTVRQLLQEQELDRRRFERFTVSHKVTFQVMGKDDTVGERTFRGELDNISQGGLAFVLRIVKRENRRMLFGRRLIVATQLDDQKFQYTGVVVSVSCQDIQDHDYAVHVAFNDIVSKESIQPLIPAEPVEEELPEPNDGQETTPS